MSIAVYVAEICLLILKRSNIGIGCKCPGSFLRQADCCFLCCIVLVQGTRPAGAVFKLQGNAAEIIGKHIALELLVSCTESEVTAIASCFAPAVTGDVDQGAAIGFQNGVFQIGDCFCVRDVEHRAGRKVREFGILRRKACCACACITGEALIEHHAMLYLANELGIFQFDGVLAFNDSNLAAGGCSLAVCCLDGTRRIDAGTAIACGRETAAGYSYRTFPTVCSKSGTVCAFCCDLNI